MPVLRAVNGEAGSPAVNEFQPLVGIPYPDSRVALGLDFSVQNALNPLLVLV